MDLLSRKQKQPSERSPSQPRVERECLVCGKPFMALQSEIKRRGGRFCSNRCRGLGQPRLKLPVDRDELLALRARIDERLRELERAEPHE